MVPGLLTEAAYPANCGRNECTSGTRYFRSYTPPEGIPIKDGGFDTCLKKCRAQRPKCQFVMYSYVANIFYNRPCSSGEYGKRWLYNRSTSPAPFCFQGEPKGRANSAV